MMFLVMWEDYGARPEEVLTWSFEKFYCLMDARYDLMSARETASIERHRIVKDCQERGVDPPRVFPPRDGAEEVEDLNDIMAFQLSGMGIEVNRSGEK